MFWKKKKIIVTHSSKFHSDDIFAVATLILMLEKEGSEYEVVRTRDPKIISKADFVVDVGDIYDEANNRFDHHQEGRAGVRDNGIPYASFGLVWKKFGEYISGEKNVADKIEQLLVQPIDAHDNGILFFDSKIKGVTPFDIDSIRHSFLPTWKEGFKDIDAIFVKMVSVAKILLSREIVRAQDDEEAKTSVEKMYEESKDKRLVIFDMYYPADSYLVNFPEPLFYVFPSSDDGTWILHTIQDDLTSYINRKDLPTIWAGKRNTELEKITGVSGAVFCHNNLFLAVAKTKEAVLKLAEIALNS